jgi:hypothetical protein
VGTEQILADDALQQTFRVGEEFGRLRANLGVRKDGRVLAAQLPGHEERRPIDVRNDIPQWKVAQHAGADKFRAGRRGGVPIDGKASSERLGVGHQFALPAAGKGLAFAFLGGAVVAVERGPLLRPDQPVYDAGGAGGVFHVHDCAVVSGRDFDRRVLGTGRRAADQQRDLETLAFHFAGDVDHFVERWRNQAGKADDVRLLLAGGGEDLFARDHDAQVNDFVVVAAEDDADDVFADVVDVAFHGCHDDLAAGAAG